jgi:hypothetical protein
VTEAEWLASEDPGPLLEATWPLPCEGPASRKRRLLGCAYCRRQWERLGQAERNAVEAAERLADELASRGQFRDAFRDQFGSDTIARAFTRLLWSVGDGPDHRLMEAVGWWEQEWGAAGQRAAHAHLVRDAFGNPFRPAPAVDPGWLAWNGGTARKLAEGVYAERAFDRLPVLADALEDAGCCDADLLGHLRGPGPHVRGCWAVDLLLGKE